MQQKVIIAGLTVSQTSWLRYLGRKGAYLIVVTPDPENPIIVRIECLPVNMKEDEKGFDSFPNITELTDPFFEPQTTKNGTWCLWFHQKVMLLVETIHEVNKKELKVVK